MLATGDVGTVDGEERVALKDTERRPLPRDEAVPWSFDDLSETEAISEEMGFGRTRGGVDLVSLTTVLVHSKVSDVLVLDTVSELMGLLCRAGGVDGASVITV